MLRDTMTTMLRITSAGLLTLLAQPSAAQGATPDLPTLARQVGGAHRPDGPTAKVEAFTCQLELHLLDVSEKNGGQANLDVAFLQQAREAPKKPRTFIRYKVRGVDRAIRRGFDRFGPWHIQQGKPADLTAAGAQRDLQSLREHTNLARQLLRFLSPEAVIESLEAPTKVVDDKLRIGRKSAAVYSVSGRLSEFPLMQRAGSDAPAFVTIYVDKSSKRLLGIDAWPIEDGASDRARGERILLSDLQLRDGLLVPRTLRYLWRDAAGKLRSHSTAKIITLDLSPNLDAKHFDRS
ncbi:MAG: hypothetical protein CMJ88_01930 [Planctomycetes bacterium]|nr:hypothetical protein [Planctomycetota bacterium]